MYSNDRIKALEYTISFLKDMELYDSCQKTLVVDSRTNYVPDEWQLLQVPRLFNKFCWGRMWDAGVHSARYEKIVYLDSDRMLPKDYLKIVKSKLKDQMFMFTSKHFHVISDTDINVCKKLVEKEEIESSLLLPEYIGRFKYETRHQYPFHGSGKNVMSGSVAFTKSTYERLGGVDHWYCGHGAFADSDFHMQASVGGCEFLDLYIPELHYPHEKLDNKNSIINKNDLHLMSLDNFIYYCDKWKLPMSLADTFAERCGVLRPTKYVNKKLKEIKEGAKIC